MTTTSLRRKPGEGRLGGSLKGGRVPRPRKELSKRELKTFRGRFAAHLESLMEAAGFTKDDLAEETGLGEATIRKWLRAEGTPDFPSMEKVADALGLDDYRLLLPPPKKS